MLIFQLSHEPRIFPNLIAAFLCSIAWNVTFLEAQTQCAYLGIEIAVRILTVANNSIEC